MNEHMRFVKKKPDGIKAGTMIKDLRSKSQLRGTIKPLEQSHTEKKTNKKNFLKRTPSVFDDDIKKLIHQYPCKK